MPDILDRSMTLTLRRYLHLRGEREQHSGDLKRCEAAATRELYASDYDDFMAFVECPPSDRDDPTAYFYATLPDPIPKLPRLLIRKMVDNNEAVYRDGSDQPDGEALIFDAGGGYYVDEIEQCERACGRRLVDDEYRLLEKWNRADRPDIFSVPDRPEWPYLSHVPLPGVGGAS